MTKNQRANAILMQIEAIQGDAYEGRFSDLLTLVNETLRDAYALAEDVVNEEPEQRADIVK